MCWNLGVSIGFSVAFFLGSAFIYKRRSFGFLGGPRDTYEALIVMNLAFVQFYEFLIWIYVYPENEDQNLCPKQNTAFTFMVYFHGVLFWPPLVNLFAIKTSVGKREYFAFPLLFGILYTILGMVDLFYTQFKINIKTTCGIDGATFLRWSVALSESRILPNGFDWFLFTAFPFVFYKPRPIGMFLFIYLILTFAIPFALVTLGEAASIFCWLGVGIFVVFMFEPYLDFYTKKYLPKVYHFELPFVSRIEHYFETKEANKPQELRSPAITMNEDDEHEEIEMGKKEKVSGDLELPI
jgi:hypothetical protein